MQKTRILLADDHAVVRTGLRLLLETQADMTVISEAATGDEAVRSAERARPHVVILDLSMPGGGTETIGRIRACAPGARVVVLTMHDDPAYLREAMAAGASGYVLKRAADRDLIQAIRAVMAGSVHVDADMALEPHRYARLPLSERELQALKLLALGHTNAEIATQLGVGIKTAETYRIRLRKKLAIDSRADIVEAAIAAGLLPRPKP